MEDEIIVYNFFYLLFFLIKKVVIKLLRDNFLLDIEVFFFNIVIDLMNKNWNVI